MYKYFIKRLIDILFNLVCLTFLLLIGLIVVPLIKLADKGPAIYADIAKQWGANVPFLRSDELSNVTASSWDVVKEVIDKYKTLESKFDTIALLQPTSPLRTSDDIVKG